MNTVKNFSISAIALLMLILFNQAAEGQSAITQYLNMKPKPKLLFDNWAAAQNKIEGVSLTARERFEKLPVSRRSTFAAVTNALLYTKLTDNSGRSIGAAIDLIANLETIAGQEAGRASDEQFRLYVKLKPESLRKLDLSREFKHDKNNTIFHKGFPINYRQDGAAPTLQFSIATDEINADIDVDYRSSGFPAALFNGHLTASNSDVRASGNYLTHLRRWAGLIDWWDEIVPDLLAESNLLKDKILPPPFLSPTDPQQATETKFVSAVIREFFNIWLIERNPDKALVYLQPKLAFCSDLKQGGDRQNLSARYRLLLYDTMKAANKELRNPKTLEQAIHSVAPVDPFIKTVEHEQKNIYTLATITDNDYNHFVCASRTSELTAQKIDERPRTYGKYYIVKFRFTLNDGKGGILRLLWSKEAEVWKILAFDAVTA